MGVACLKTSSKKLQKLLYIICRTWKGKHHFWWRIQNTKKQMKKLEDKSEDLSYLGRKLPKLNYPT